MSGMRWDGEASAAAEDIIDKLADEIGDISAEIYENSEKSFQILTLMDRALEKLDSADREDRLEAIDSCTTLLKVVKGYVSETRTEAEILDHKAHRMERLRDSLRYLKVPGPAATTCTCQTGLKAGRAH